MGLIVHFCTLDGGYEICAFVNRFLRLGNFLNPTNGLSLKVFTQLGSEHTSLEIRYISNN